LPFMTEENYKKAAYVTNKKFLNLRVNEYNSNLRGMPFYSAFICSIDGIKHFEDNSRPGDGEIIGLLAKMEDDFIDICLSMINGNLKKIDFKKLATVGTYVVPTPYPNKDKKIRNVDLTDAKKLKNVYGDNLRIYPASMEGTIAGNSRTVYLLGIDSYIEEARKISQMAAEAVKGDDLDFRKDIASEDNILDSIHMNRHMF